MDNTNNQISQLDQYSLFDLMGLGDMSADQQQKMLLDINDLVWSNFLSERLTYIFTSEQIQSIKELIDNGQKADRIIQHMSQLSSNFKDLLAEYTRYFKIEYLRKHYQDTIKDLETMLTETKDPKAIAQLQQDREKNVRAYECVNSFQWENVLKTLYPQDYQEEIK